MIIDFKTNFSYKCPSCFEFCTQGISVFDIPWKRHLTIKCKCNLSSVKIFLKGSSYVIKAPCFICMQTHTYRIPKNKFWSSDILIKECLQSSLDVCALGDEINTQRWISDYSEILKFMLEDDFE